MADILTQPEPDMSWIDLVVGHFDFPKPMGEDAYLEHWKREIAQTEGLRKVYRDVVEDLINCAYAAEAHWMDNARPHLADKAMYFAEIVYLSIRYAHACSKQHEHSAGMRAKVRGELKSVMKQWSKLDKRND